MSNSDCHDCTRELKGSLELQNVTCHYTSVHWRTDNVKMCTVFMKSRWGVSTLSKEFTGTCEHIWNLQETLWETNQLESAQLGSYLLLFADLPWLHPQLCSPFCSNPPVAVSLLLWQFSLHVPLQCFLITKRKEICLSHLSKDRKTCQLTSLLGRQVLFSIAQHWDSLWAAASPPPQTGVSKGLHPQVPSLSLP